MKFERRNNFWYATYCGQAYIGKSISAIVSLINKRNATNFEVGQ